MLRSMFAAAVLAACFLMPASAFAATPTSYTWTGDPATSTSVDLGPFDPTNTVSWGATCFAPAGQVCPSMPVVDLSIGGFGGNITGMGAWFPVTTGGNALTCAMAGIGWLWCGEDWAPSSGDVVLSFATHPDMQFGITVCKGKVTCNPLPPAAPPCGMQPSGVDTCKLKPGDILLETEYTAAGLLGINGVSADNWGGGLIREASGEYWFHAGMVTDDGSIIDFTGEGARKSGFAAVSFLQTTAQDVVVLRPRDQARVAGALAWAKARIGQNLPYYNPVQAMADAALRGESAVLSQSSEYYCSLFVWAAYASQGVDLNYASPLQHLLGIHLPTWSMLPAGPDELYASSFPAIVTGAPPATDVVQDTHPGLYRAVSTLHSPAAESITGAAGGAVWTGPRSEPQSLAYLLSPTASPLLTLVGTGTGRYTLTVETFGPGGPHAALAQAHINLGQQITYQLAGIGGGVSLVRGLGGDTDESADRD